MRININRSKIQNNSNRVHIKWSVLVGIQIEIFKSEFRNEYYYAKH